MENNQPTSELATTLILELYKDYRKEKKRALIYKIIYYVIIFSIFVWVTTNVNNLMDGVHDNKKKLPIEEHIAVVKITGAIMPDQEASFENIEKLLKKAFENERSLGVVLDIDSPGGSVYEAEVIIQLIESLKSKYPNKKVISHARMLAASAAYEIALFGEKIYAQGRNSLLGSIGTRMSTFNVFDIMTEHKIKYIDIHAGAHKTDLDPFTPINPEAITFYQGQANKNHLEFIQLVKEHRGERLKPTEDMFSGRAWRAVDCLEMGLIDEIKPFEEMIKAEYGDYPTKVITLPQEMNLKSFIKDSLQSLSQGVNQFFYSQTRAYYA